MLYDRTFCVRFYIFFEGYYALGFFMQVFFCMVSPEPIILIFKQIRAADVFICGLIFLGGVKYESGSNLLNVKNKVSGGKEMNRRAVEMLEYDKIKERLKSFAMSEITKGRIDNLEPSIDICEIERNIRETTEGRNLINRNSGVPLNSLIGMENIMLKLNKGGVLDPEEFKVVSNLLFDSIRLKRYMEEKEFIAPNVSLYAASMYSLPEVVDEIERCIVNGEVDDRASSELSRIRKKIGVLESRIKSKLDSILRSPAWQKCLQDNIVSVKDGRFVIPVKNEYRKSLKGSVINISSSGSTAFIEPEEVKNLQDEMNALRIDEEREVFRILSTLTNLVFEYEREININIDIMTHYDFVFSKAKYSRVIEGREVRVNSRGYINIISGKHPLIEAGAVPLNFRIGNDYRALVITGPNTGGKTVALKTVGLLTMMVQSGLHVPVDEGSEFGVYSDILVDIGDGQSIEQSLSTFSSHIKNIIGILECAGEDNLIILDELGAGTDPGEGMGLAISILERLYEKGSTILATTHYSEIKDFALKKDGFENGCMEFDINTLKPLYRLSIGKSGESNAFLIALKLGMKKDMIERAHEITYGERKSYDNNGNDQITEVKNMEVIEEKKLIVEKKQRTEELKKQSERLTKKSSFKLGDCVYISSLGGTGIVCELENSKGEVGIMCMKKKIKVNKKRLSLYIDSKELYPEDYDFDIVFETKENRRAKKLLSKRHVEGVSIKISDDK